PFGSKTRYCLSGRVSRLSEWATHSGCVIMPVIAGPCLVPKEMLMRKNSRWQTWVALGVGLGLGYAVASFNFESVRKSWAASQSTASLTDQPAGAKEVSAPAERTKQRSVASVEKPN